MTTISIHKQVRNQNVTHLSEIKDVVQTEKKAIFQVEQLNLSYGDTQALKDIQMTIYDREVTAIIGPSGCGKSTFLKTLNRLVELIPHVKMDATIKFQGKDIF